MRFLQKLFEQFGDPAFYVHHDFLAVLFLEIIFFQSFDVVLQLGIGVFVDVENLVIQVYVISLFHILGVTGLAVRCGLF